MKKKYTIIGSGVAGVNAALTLLRKGYLVEMLDYGNLENPPASNKSTFNGMKNNAYAGLQFFYGDKLNGISGQDSKEVFEYPVRRNSISKKSLMDIQVDVSQFEPIFSDCMGGLGLAWGANSVEFNQNDLIDFGIKKEELVPYYKIAFDRFKVSGPVEIDAISNIANASYKFKNSFKISRSDSFLLSLSKLKDRFFGSGSVLIGQSRLAINTEPNSAAGCTSCGLCIWGCPQDAIYSPIQTLLECRKYNSFTYQSGVKVKHFLKVKEQITEIIDASGTSYAVEHVILAAGAINSAIIYTNSLKVNEIVKGSRLRTKGLLDTEVIKVPYLFAPSCFTRFNSEKIQFNQLLSFVKNEDKRFPQWVQVELLSLGSLIYHPLLRKIPIGVRNGLLIFNKLKNMVGVATFFLPDRQKNNNYIEIDYTKKVPLVTYNYTRSEEKEKLLNSTLQKFVRYMRSIGTIINKGAVIRGNQGAGIHYAGTIPIRSVKELACVDVNCRSYDFSNLHVVDASVFPSLPSKSLTLTIAANAMRVCDKL